MKLFGTAIHINMPRETLKLLVMRLGIPEMLIYQRRNARLSIPLEPKWLFGFVAFFIMFTVWPNLVFLLFWIAIVMKYCSSKRYEISLLFGLVESYSYTNQEINQDETLLVTLSILLSVNKILVCFAILIWYRSKKKVLRLKNH